MRIVTGFWVMCLGLVARLVRALVIQRLGSGCVSERGCVRGRFGLVFRQCRLPSGSALGGRGRETY